MLTNLSVCGIILKGDIMPRQARRLSSTGIYHIMLRGINQQNIFEDTEDKEKFIQTLKTYKAVSEFKIFAYCLMSNHIHLLIKVEKESLDLIIKRLAGSYVYWYNWKYRRKGHLFQDRFKSEPVEDDAYFLTVIRYIHQNPVRGELCKRVNEYQYSSFNEYIDGSYLVDTEFCLDIIDKEKFVSFNNQFSDDVCLDIEENDYRMTDEEAKAIIFKTSRCKTAANFQSLSIEKRDKYLKICKGKGISIRQLSRITGVSFGVVRKI